MSSIALVDCNNFFVSCERLFNPKLMGRPVVVLSGNDGCIIARSQEVKNLRVPMGAPYFQWADFLKKHEAAVCSSNFPLYGDLSNRVMQTLSYFNPDLEIYSIDEAFLHIEKGVDPLVHCLHIRHKVLQWTGIPVSIGIASTKTLAKVANQTAKKNPSFNGVYIPTSKELEAILYGLAVGDVWGIGRRLSSFLAKRGIHTAAQLCAQSDIWIKQHLSVVGLRTVWELRGIPCFEVEETPSSKQSLMTSRTFGRPILTEAEVLEAVSSFAARGAEKLRQQESLASWLQVFIMTSAYKEENYYGNQAHLVLSQPSAFTPTLLEYATRGVKAIFRPHFAYKKAGVLLGGLVPKHHFQQDIFIEQDPAQEAKREALMSLIDAVNHQFDHPILHFASEGISQSWKRKNEMCSASFTTRWSDILTIHI